MSSSEWVAGIVIGLVAATLFRVLVEPALPSRLKESGGYWLKRVRLYLTPPHIDTTLVVTATPSAPVSIKEFVACSKQTIAGEGYRLDASADSISFRVPVGQFARSKPHSYRRALAVSFDIIPDLDNELMLDGIEIRICNAGTLRNIGSRLTELDNVWLLVKTITARLWLEPVTEMCLVCELNEMANVRIMLKATQETSIPVRMANGRGFELAGNKITCYTEMLSPDIIKTIKQFIMAYA